MEIKGFSLTQPYATLVVLAAKTVETRSWGTPYRGYLAIHAAKGFPAWAIDACFEYPFHQVLSGGGYTEKAWLQDSRAHRAALKERLPLGAIVAVAKLTACISTNERLEFRHWYKAPTKLDRLLERGHERAFGDYSRNRYAWVLEDVRRLPEPIPYKGALALWPIETAIAERLEEVLCD